MYELRGKFISVFKYLESVTLCTSHSLFPKCNNGEHYQAVYLLGAVVAIFFPPTCVTPMYVTIL